MEHVGIKIDLKRPVLYILLTEHEYTGLSYSFQEDDYCQSRIRKPILSLLILMFSQSIPGICPGYLLLSVPQQYWTAKANSPV